MGKVGFVNLNETSEYLVKRQLDVMNALNIDTLIYESKELMNLDLDTELVIYDIKSLDQTLVQLEKILVFLKTNNIQLTIANEESQFHNLPSHFILSLLIELVDGERDIVRKRTVKGLAEAKRKGHVGGRPKISEETIERIKYLHRNQSGTLREIAAECGVSLGTVYKYVQLD